MASNTPSYTTSDALVKCVMLALSQGWGREAFAILSKANISSDMATNPQAQALLGAFFDSQGNTTWQALTNNHAKNKPFLEYVNGIADNLRPAWVSQPKAELPAIAKRVVEDYEERVFVAELDKVLALRNNPNRQYGALRDAVIALSNLQSSTDQGVMMLGELRSDFNQMLADFKAGKPDKWIVPSGFPSLDLVIQGFANGQVTFLVGDTGTGKSTFVQAIVTRVGYKLLQEQRKTGKGGCILIANGEMEGLDNYGRMVAAVSGESRQEWIAGKANWELVNEAADIVDNLPIAVNQNTESLTIPLIRKWVRQTITRTGQPVRLVVIDYDDLVEIDGNDSIDRAKKRGNQLKQLASSLTNPDGTKPAVVVIKDSNRNKANANRVHWEMNDAAYGGGFAAGLMIGLTDITKMIQEGHTAPVVDFIDIHNKTSNPFKLSIGMFIPSHADYIPGLKVGFVFKNRFGREGVFFVIVDADVTRVNDIFDDGIPVTNESDWGQRLEDITI